MLKGEIEIERGQKKKNFDGCLRARERKRNYVNRYRTFRPQWSLTRLNRRDMEAKQVERLMGPERCRPNLFDGAPVESPAF